MAATASGRGNTRKNHAGDMKRVNSNKIPNPKPPLHDSFGRAGVATRKKGSAPSAKGAPSNLPAGNK